MTSHPSWPGLRRWLARIWEHMPFARHRGGPGLAGVREPRRPRPPTRPPLAQAAEPEAEGFLASPVAILTREGRRRWWWRRRPHAGPA